MGTRAKQTAAELIVDCNLDCDPDSRRAGHRLQVNFNVMWGCCAGTLEG
jgi:hypothetical protein